MAKPKWGFTYPTVTGENKITAFRRILSEFPNMQVWSDYQNGTDLPNWNDPWFTEAPDDCIFLISIKHTDVNAIGARMATIPPHLRGRIIIILHHEPDQWRSVEDPRGDPAPSVWKQRNTAFAQLRAGAPWANWIQHWACFTEDRLRTDKAFWMANWGDWVLSEAGQIFDGVAWDTFNIGRSIIRTGADLYGEPLKFNRQGEFKLIIRENGQVVPVDTPNDNQQVADAIHENWEYAKTQNEIDEIFLAIVWYYNHNNTLVDPSGNRPGRPLTMNTIEDIMADARTPEQPPVEPDPTDPQYIYGRESRQAEIDELVAQVDGLQEQIAQLQGDLTAALNQAATAHQQGRLAAFADTSAWAQQQT